MSVELKDALQVARELRKEIDENGWPKDSVYKIYCISCKTMIPFGEYQRHLRTNDHLVNELAMQDKTKKDTKWVEKHWPPTKDSGRWCTKCERLIMDQDFYAHLESHRKRVRSKRM